MGRIEEVVKLICLGLTHSIRNVGASLADKLSISQIILLQNPPLQSSMFRHFA